MTTDQILELLDALNIRMLTAHDSGDNQGADAYKNACSLVIASYTNSRIEAIKGRLGPTQ